MSLSDSQFKLLLSFFTLKRTRLVTESDTERDESDLRDACNAIDDASMVIVPKGLIESLYLTISDLNGKIKKANLFDEGASV
jgi:hypothetical protein